jgi:hypothetical protein
VNFLLVLLYAFLRVCSAVILAIFTKQKPQIAGSFPFIASISGIAIRVVGLLHTAHRVCST